MRNIFILLALLCASCGTALPTIKPYKLDVQQGNVVTSKMLLQLRPGMTKSQVRFIMGTPLIQDSFHGNRWDYVYLMREAGKIKEQRRVILDFENELLKTVRGDVIAAGSDLSKATETDAPIGTRVVTPLKKPAEKSLVDKLKFWQKDEAEPAKQAAEKEAAAKAKLDTDESLSKAAANETAANQAVVNETPANNTPSNKTNSNKTLGNEMAAPQVNDNTPPVAEEPESLLAVPIEAPPVEIPSAATQATVPVPVVDVPQPAAPAAEAVQSVAPVSEPVRELVPAAAAPVMPVSAEVATEAKAADDVPAAAPLESPAKAPYYQSESGMQFDRQLQTEVEEEPAQLPSGPRSGNKVAPKPKELPQENDPSFFDRMLEKIGF